MLETNRLSAAARRHNVALSDKQADTLTALLRQTEVTFSRSIADESLDDLFGRASAGRVENAIVAARKVVRSCVAAAKGNFHAPDAADDWEPMISGVVRAAALPQGASADHADKIASSARVIANAIARALDSVPEEDKRRLAAVQLRTDASHRPAADSGLSARMILATYYFCHQAGMDLGFALGNSARNARPSLLVRLTLAVLEAAELPASAETVRMVVNAYRAKVLNRQTEAVGIKEKIAPEPSHFLAEPVDFAQVAFEQSPATQSTET